MKILIGVITAHHESRTPYVEKMRARLKDSPIDYKFVYGSAASNDLPNREPLADELFFDVDDRREWMVLKNKELFKYAMANGYDFVFRCCDDTALYPERLLQHAPLLALHDYAGTFCGHGNYGGKIFCLRYMDYCHGGVGVWLSHKAMNRLLADDWKGPTPSPYPMEMEVMPGIWHPSYDTYWDDLWMGEVLKGNLRYGERRRNDLYNNYGDIMVYDDPNLFAYAKPFDRDKVISTHEEAVMGESLIAETIPPFSSVTDKIVY